MDCRAHPTMVLHVNNENKALSSLLTELFKKTSLRSSIL